MLGDVRFGQKVKRKALIAEHAVFRGDRAYARIPPDRPGRLPVVFEFVRIGARYQLVAAGRYDYPSYVGLFAEARVEGGRETHQPGEDKPKSRTLYLDAASARCHLQEATNKLIEVARAETLGEAKQLAEDALRHVEVADEELRSEHNQWVDELESH